MDWDNRDWTEYGKTWWFAGAGPDDIRREVQRPEVERFGGVMFEERSRYHSVSPGKPPANYSINDQPSTLPDLYDSIAFDPFGSYFSHSSTALSRLIPQDGRIALAFDLHWQPKQDEHYWKMDHWEADGSADQFKEYLQEKANSKLESLRSFRKEIEEFGNFIIWDADPSKPENGHVLYNLNDSDCCAVIPREEDQMVKSDHELQQWLDKQTWYRPPTQSEKAATWQRIILCEGLPLATNKKDTESFPFLVFDDRNEPINMATNIHLSCERRGGSELSNPYSNPDIAFHITFYERLTKENLGLTAEDLPRLIKESRTRDLKVGHLYSKQPEDNNKKLDELAFRQSSFTMITAAQKGLQSDTPSIVEDYWTMLILSPSGFFSSPDEKTLNKGLEMFLGQRSKKSAELSIIVYAFRKVEERWRQLNEYIGSLLIEDFMDPEAYSKLLFDNDLSRSKRYFWAIGCLNEFTVSIEDNIKQLELFRKDRIPHSSGSPSETPALPSLPQELLGLDEEAKKVKQSFEDLKAEFKAKLVTIQALRDGLFSATSVREALQSTELARASTRLAEESSRQNRYILVFTVATVFYLPISFVATFYGMHLFDPHGNPVESRTPFIVTVILLSLTTYAVAGCGLRLVDYNHRSDTKNEEEDTEDKTPGKATQSNGTDAGARKSNGCLSFLRRRKKSNEVV